MASSNTFRARLVRRSGRSPWTVRPDGPRTKPSWSGGPSPDPGGPTDLPACHESPMTGLCDGCGYERVDVGDYGGADYCPRLHGGHRVRALGSRRGGRLTGPGLAPQKHPGQRGRAMT